VPLQYTDRQPTRLSRNFIAPSSLFLKDVKSSLAGAENEVAGQILNIVLQVRRKGANAKW
jgi:hypothetical protein